MLKIAFLRSKSIYDDSRATKEICVLLDAGYEVSVFAWDRDGTANEKCKKIFGNYKNVHLYFFDSPIGGVIGGKNIFKLLKWCVWLYKNISKKQFDVIHACDFDTAISAYICSKKKSSILVYDIFDYYVDSHYVPILLKPLVELIDTFIINFSNLTIVCTEQRQSQLRFARPKKLVVIHNSPNVSTVEKTNICYDYVYCGILNDGRLLKEILTNYHNYSDLKFCFAGSGKYEQLATDLMNKFPNFTYKGSIPYSEVLELEQKSVCLSAIYDPVLKNHKLAAPNKFYESLALGKPLIVCKGTGIDEIVNIHNIGNVINYSSKEFYDSIYQFKNNKKLCETIYKTSRSLYENEYNWSIMKSRLIRCYKKFECKE